MREHEEKIVPVYEPGSKFSKWFENFWYHHKWKVIIISFFVIVLLICTVQMCSREEMDLYIMYAGPDALTQQNIEDLKLLFANVTPDKNGDGYSKTEFIDLYILSPQQIEEKKQELKEAGDVAAVNYEMFASYYDQFEQHIWTGDAVICLLDPHLYETVYVEKDGEKLSGFMRLEDVLGEKPENAYDDYSIKLKDTEFGEYCNLDEDILLCIRKKSTASFMSDKKKTDEYHAYCVEVFKNIVNFTAS